MQLSNDTKLDYVSKTVVSIQNVKLEKKPYT